MKTSLVSQRRVICPTRIGPPNWIQHEMDYYHVVVVVADWRHVRPCSHRHHISRVARRTASSIRSKVGNRPTVDSAWGVTTAPSEHRHRLRPVVEHPVMTQHRTHSQCFQLPGAMPISALARARVCSSGVEHPFGHLGEIQKSRSSAKETRQSRYRGFRFFLPLSGSCSC